MMKVLMTHVDMEEAPAVLHVGAPMKSSRGEGNLDDLPLLERTE